MTVQEALSPAFAFSVLDYLPDAIVWMRPVFSPEGPVEDFEVGYANKAAYGVVNHPTGELQGLRILRDGVPSPEGAQENFRHYLDVYLSGEVKEYEFLAHNSGRRIETVRRVFEGGVLSTTRDRQVQQAAARQIEEQRNLLDNIMQHSSNGITVGEMVRDSQGAIVDIRTLLANEAALKFTGVPREVYLSKTGGEIDPAFTTSDYFQRCKQCMETGEPFFIQYYLEAVGRWMEISVSRMDEDRQIYIFTDVTSAKEAQLALEHSQARLQAIINRTQSGILTAAPVKNEEGAIVDFRFVLANRALAAYVGQEPEALVGELGSQWFTGYMQNGLFELFCDTYQNNKINRYDYHYCADGIDAWIDLMCTPFGEEVLVTFNDYTPVKLLQLQLEQKVEELKRSNKNLEEFAYAASHDLKEPIRKINFFSDRLKSLLAERQDSEEAAMVERMEKAAQRMGLLVDDLLEYSHISRGIDKLEEVDLNKKLHLVLEDLELTVQDKKASIIIEHLPVIKGHKRQMQQLFQNLVSNALKYSKADVPPHITITSRTINGSEAAGPVPVLDQSRVYHLVEVRDNGIGFDQEYAERIFNVFTRLHGKGEYPGAGVGLSIVRKVVENHQGYIWAESVLGEGSVFKLLLPAEA